MSIRSGDTGEPGLSAARTPKGAAFTAASKASSLPVFVDVGSRKVESQIERDGVPIGIVTLDPVLLKDRILDRPVLRVRVVQQSVAPGTPVPVGTSVDLVMASPGDLPLGVITGVHQGLKDATIAEAFTTIVKDNPVVNRIVSRAVAGQLAPEDTVALREIFNAIPEGKGTIDDEPGTDINAAVETLKALTTFGA